MDLSTLLIYAFTLGVACAVPGPTTAALVARVLGRGSRGALAFCAGLMAGDLLWLSATALGLAMLAATMQPVFIVIKYAGAAYLLYLAWRLWTAPAATPVETQPVRGEGLRLFLTGISVCLGNPKTTLFYLALLPTIIDLQHLSWIGFGEITATLVVVYGTVLAAYVVLALRARRMFRSPRALKAINRVTGAVMAGAAVAVATR
ncbi:LysE family translocator [Inquilinus limosus]|uniref:Lysine transporter LysE n=1 Tax=Inquilinus limosus TaxID=171674 RepID=A0A211Z9Z0_9PROT|nr:LysE family translocator [Inquilinus limosus]OWJ62073.1 lysine transporter LysE [Inquilinus limosus]